MNLIIYGFGSDMAASLAERYGFALYDTFDELEQGNGILLQPRLQTPQELLEFSKSMNEHLDKIDLVIAAECDSGSTVHYCSQQDKFFTVNLCEDPADTEYDIVRIIDTQLGRLCAHEGI